MENLENKNETKNLSQEKEIGKTSELEVSKQNKGIIGSKLIESKIVETKENEKKQNKEVNFKEDLEKTAQIKNENQIPLKNKQKKENMVMNDFYEYLTGNETYNPLNLVDLHKNQKYMNESDNFYGDIIISFPNPDHESIESSVVDFKAAISFFERAFNFDIQCNEGKLFKKNFMRSFAKAFKTIKTHNLKEKQLPDKDLGRQQDGEGEEAELGKRKGNKSNQEMFKDLDIKLKHKKLFSHGGYLEEIEGFWYRSDHNTKDFLTLMRNTILVKLAKEKGFATRVFLSEDGSEIYATCFSNLENVKLEAEKITMDKEIELGLSDLLSLEPVDSAFRPLRINTDLLVNLNKKKKKTISKKKNEEEEEEKKKKNKKKVKLTKSQNLLKNTEFIELSKKINDLIEEIDFKRMSRDVGLSLVGDRDEEIIDNVDIPIKVWKVYYYYLTEIKDKILNARKLLSAPYSDEEIIEAFEILLKKGKATSKKETHSKIIMQRRSQIVSYMYKAILIEGMEAANKKFKGKILKNLWYPENPMFANAYTDYFIPEGGTKFSKKIKLDSIWRKYRVNAMGRNEIFSNMERLKLAHFSVSQVLNLSLMKSYGIINNYYYLNDPYQLWGKNKAKSFEDYQKYMSEEIEKINLQRQLLNSKSEANLSANDKMKYSFLKSRFEVKKDKAVEKVTSKKKKRVNIEEINKLMKERVEKKEKNIEKLICLSDSWRLSLFKLTEIPVKDIRNYYGEKIALYFKFLGYYTHRLWWIGIFGIIVFVIQQLFDYNSNNQIVLNVIFGLMVTFWSTYILEDWRLQELKFAHKFGQMEFEDEEQERPSFVGTFKRSLINDFLNEMWSSDFSRSFKQFLALLICLFFLGTNMLISVYISYIVTFLDKNQFLPNIPFISLELTLPAIVNIAFMMIFNELFETVASVSTDWENHRTLSSYESSYVGKVFIFNFLNYISPMIFISFVNSELMGCYNGNCLYNLRIYFRTLIYILFIKNFFEILGPSIKNAIIEKIHKSKKKDLESKRKKNLLKKNNRFNAYRKINSYIQKEGRKEPYAESEDIDGTVSDYLEVAINYGLLSLFGVAFPAAFLSSFVLMVSEIHVDKARLFNYCQRPVPQSCGSIGFWLIIMDFVSYLSLLVNTGIICFTSGSFSNDRKFLLFIVILLINFGFKFITQLVHSGTPDSVKNMIKRHETVADKTAKSFQKVNKNIKPEASLPIYKIWGTKLPGGDITKSEVILENK